MNERLKLGINIDHVATIRNARGGILPDPIRAATIAEKAGADSITAHLREDRRHITDDDIGKLIKGVSIPLNLEIAATDEMIGIALKHKPRSVCIVPEKREERTTEGGLDLMQNQKKLKHYIEKLSKDKIRVSLFIEPDPKSISIAKEYGVPVIELHTGSYCDALETKQNEKLRELEIAAKYANKIGLHCHAGHGLTFDTVKAIAAIPSITELNIGHFIVGEAIFDGLETVIKQMRSIIDQVRTRSNIKASL